jgi:hypothetical protein
VITVLKQATDFRYFAAKMYAYNVMLDREAACSFLLHGEDPSAFFVTEAVAEDEVKLTDQQAILATAQLNEVEASLGLPPSTPNQIAQETALPEPPVNPEPKLPAPKPRAAPLEPLAPAPSKPDPLPVPKPVAMTHEVQISAEQRAELQRKIQADRQQLNASIDAAEIARRKAAFEKRKQDLVAARRTQCREEIDLNLARHETPEVEPEEDPMAALRRALAGRVRTIIDEN